MKIFDSWLNQIRELGWDYYFPTVFLCLTGLRPSEACLSLSMLAEKGVKGYYNDQLKALEHFRFKGFLRQTKNCYLSFLSDKVLDLALHYGKPVSWNKIRCKIYQSGLKVRLHELRKVWATKLHDGGISLESVNLLQG